MGLLEGYRVETMESAHPTRYNLSVPRFLWKIFQATGFIPCFSSRIRSSSSFAHGGNGGF